MKLAVLHIAALALLAAHSAAVAQKSAEQIKADADQAGMFEAFRVCLKQEKEQGRISTQVYGRCDLAAERVYFGMYNTDYAGRTSPISKMFVDEAQKVVNNIVSHPRLCQGNADFNRVGAAIAQDIKGFYPDHPDVDCNPPPPPCQCQTPNVTGEATSSSTSNMIMQSPWPGQTLQTPKMRPALKVYTDYCIGRTVDGIMFVPQTVNAGPLHCDAKDVHIRQFITTTCADGNTCGQNVATTCGTRNFNTWYLDECQDPPVHFLTPDSSLDPKWKGPHVINDEPTPNIIDIPGNPALKDTFQDVIMCGPDQVLGAFTWTRTGVQDPAIPQWCSVTDEHGTRLKVMRDAPYSGVQEEDPKSTEIRNAVCAAAGDKDFVTDAGIDAIRDNFGDCTKH
jgi:hypothetical protein